MDCQQDQQQQEVPTTHQEPATTTTSTVVPQEAEGETTTANAGEQPPAQEGAAEQQEEQPQGEGEKARERGGEFEPNIVFVGNLDYKTTWQKLKDVFRRAGPVRFADLIADSDGRPKGSALVTFENEAGANAAIKMFHDDDFDGRRILCRRFEVGRRPAFVRHQNQPRDRKFVPGMGHQPMHGPHGQMRPPHHHHHQHHGGHMHPHHMHMGGPQGGGYGGEGEVPRPRSQQHRSDGKLFVSNLPFECTSQSLRDTFGQVGHVVDATIIHSANGRSRGMGLVEFATRREAEVAIQEFDGIQMASRPMQVRFERSVQQQQQQQQMQQQQQQMQPPPAPPQQ